MEHIYKKCCPNHLEFISTYFYEEYNFEEFVCEACSTKYYIKVKKFIEEHESITGLDLSKRALNFLEKNGGIKLTLEKRKRKKVEPNLEE